MNPLIQIDRNFMGKDKKNKIKLITLISCILLIIFRCPELIINPRMFAEEGTYYYSNAYRYANTYQWFKGLTYIQVGYFALWPNIASTIAANLFPLILAPFITTFLALLIQIMPFWIVLYGDSELWENDFKKITLVLIIMFVPLTTEIWLTTITSQFVFGLITFLILHSKIDNKKKIYRALLLIGGLSGIISCIFTPLFLFKGIVKKNREILLQAMILLSCSVIQISIVLLNVGQRPPISSFILGNLSWAPLSQCFGYLIFGYHGASYIYSFFSFILATNYFIVISLSFIILTIFILYFLFKYSRLNLIDKTTVIVSFVLVLYVSLIGALNDNYIIIGNGSRYFYIPNIILVTFFLANWKSKNSFTSIYEKKYNNFIFILLIIPIFWGMLKFTNNNSISNKNCPSWRSEIQKWEKDNKYELQNCPTTFQKIKLQKNKLIP